jgi:hypothetical protein
MGKAMGIPSVTSVGRGGEMSHAWIGFLRKGGPIGGYRWDFSEARWGDYTDVVGAVVEPHTGRQIPEAAVHLTLNMIGADRARAEAAVALKDAAERLGELRESRAIRARRRRWTGPQRARRGRRRWRASLRCWKPR